MNYPTRWRVAQFFFLRSHTHLKIFGWGNLDGVCSSSTDLKIIMNFLSVTWRDAQFSFPIPVVPSLKKKTKKSEKDLAYIARTMINHDRYSVLSLLEIREMDCFVFSTFFTYSGQFTWKGHRKLQRAMSKTTALKLSARDSWAETANYARVLGYNKKGKKTKRKEKKNQRLRNPYARVRP